jgi:ABC transport system ATP-binding/permease protein
MQLFAIIAKLDGIQDAERKVVELFLRQQIDGKDVPKYMDIFEKYASKKSKLTIDFEASNFNSGERASVRDSSKMLLICTQINQELTQQQKIFVLIRLFELIVSDGAITDQEYEFANTVADVFNIRDEEFDQIEQFITDNQHVNIDTENLLVIDSELPIGYQKRKHIFHPTLEGKFSILRIPSVEMYLLRYFGPKTYFLSGQVLNNHHVFLFPTGSTIKGANLKTIYYSDIVSKYLQEEDSQKISFEAKEIFYQFRDGTKSLHDINIAEKSGTLVGLMGASGSGKSTLLEVLNGNRPPTSGQVLINGIDLYKDKKQVEGIIGYVPQDDLLIEQLTVFENLYYAARLCYGNYSDLQIKLLVKKTLISLGLYEVAYLRVGSTLDKTISGGQRKRLNIGLELLRTPSILFIDEPTSGLSSQDSENIMDLLKELSLKGKLIFVVIHQPSSDIFKMFDRLYILDKGGYPVYYGNPVEAVVYFKKLANQINSEKAVCLECGNVNSEHIFEIIETRVVNEFGRFTDKRKVPPIEWYNRFKTNLKLPRVKTAKKTLIKNANLASKTQQIGIFLQRDFISKISNRQYLILSTLVSPSLAFILGYISKYNQEGQYIFSQNDNVPVFIFMSIIVALFLGLIVSAEELYKDRKILKRESFINLSRGSYLIAKVALLFAISAFQTLLYVFIGNWLIGIKHMDLVYWIVLFSTSCFANMLGLNISSAFNSAVTIYILIPIVLIPQLILGGIVISYDKINPSLASEKTVPLISETMASRWAFEALTVSQFKDNPFEKEFYAFNKTLSLAEYKKVYLIPALDTYLSSVYLSNLNQTITPLHIQKLNTLILHLKKENAFTGIKPSFAIENIKSPQDLSFEKASQIRQYLHELSQFYKNIFNNCHTEKDKKISSMVSTQAGNDKFIKMQTQYFNQSLSDLVKNHHSKDRIMDKNGKLVQKVNLIYKDPEPNSLWDFRAHFYAPEKHFLGFYMDTLWANTLAIWCMTILLFGLLYLDAFRRAIQLKEHFSKIYAKTNISIPEIKWKLPKPVKTQQK